MGRRTKYWIQRAVKREGRCSRYLKRLYGNRAFYKDGRIKASYIKKAIQHVKRTYSKGDKRRKSLLSMLNLCYRFVTKRID